MNHRTRGALAGLLLATIAVGSPAQAASQPRDLRREVLDAARARGVDAAPLLGREISVPGGIVTLGAFIDGIDAARAQTAPGDAPGSQVGDIFHYALSYGGVDLPAIYRETASQGVPPTDPLTVEIPGTPAGNYSFVEYGGRVRQLKTSPYAIGLHTAGGSMLNIGTAEGGGAIYASALSNGNADDTGLDFTGHIGSLTNVRECWHGFCIAVGVLFGDGVALYGSGPIAGVIPRPGTPRIP